MFRALQVVERDSLAIAERLRATRLITCIASATPPASFKNPCLMLLPRGIGTLIHVSGLRLNEEMKGVDNLALQLKIFRRNVDALDSGVNKLLRLP